MRRALRRRRRRQAGEKGGAARAAGAAQGPRRAWRAASPAPTALPGAPPGRSSGSRAGPSRLAASESRLSISGCLAPWEKPACVGAERRRRCAGFRPQPSPSAPGRGRVCECRARALQAPGRCRPQGHLSVPPRLQLRSLSSSTRARSPDVPLRAAQQLEQSPLPQLGANSLSDLGLPTRIFNHFSPRGCACLPLALQLSSFSAQDGGAKMPRYCPGPRAAPDV
ncbi:hypothetical protein R6Z07F_001437 [Ovis aries]